jgi:hypothetical protein
LSLINDEQHASAFRVLSDEKGVEYFKVFGFVPLVRFELEFLQNEIEKLLRINIGIKNNGDLHIRFDLIQQVTNPAPISPVNKTKPVDSASPYSKNVRAFLCPGLR